MKRRLKPITYFRIFMAILVSALIVLFWINDRHKAGQYRKLVQNGELTLKTDIEWPDKGDSVVVKFWVHNKGQINVRGIFIFEVSLNYLAIDTKFLQKEKLSPEWAKGIRNWMDRFNVESPKAEAVLNFIDRGKRLKDSLTTEPCELRTESDSLFVFCLTKPLDIGPGQLQKVTMVQEIDGYKIGFEYSAKIKRIEPRFFPLW